MGEILERVQKKNSDGQYSQDDILACSLGTELDKKTIFFGLRSTEESVKSYRIVNVGDVIYTKSPIKGYPNGIVRTCKITDGIVPSLYCVYKEKENNNIPIDTRFIQSYLEDKCRLDAYLFPLVNVGARNNVNITDKEFLEGSIYIPNTKEEQTIIVSVLENITNLITLHQRKYISLKLIFITWEQRKLGEVFIEYSEKNHEELPPLTIIQGGGTILREKSDRNIQYDKSSLTGYKMVRKDDFILHLRSFEGGLEKANSDGIISPAYHTFHGKFVDSRFYYPFFRSKRFIETLLKPHVYGIRDGKSIDISGMKSIKIPVPSFKEQQKIGSYIESLDNLITLHRRAQSHIT